VHGTATRFGDGVRPLAARAAHHRPGADGVGVRLPIALPFLASAYFRQHNKMSARSMRSSGPLQPRGR